MIDLFLKSYRFKTVIVVETLYSLDLIGIRYRYSLLGISEHVLLIHCCYILTDRVIRTLKQGLVCNYYYLVESLLSLNYFTTSIDY